MSLVIFLCLYFTHHCLNLFSIHFDFNQATAFEGSVLTHSDVKPGMVMKAKITAVDDFGAIVQFPGGVKALCPVPHMSELEIARPRKKFRVLFQPWLVLVSCHFILEFSPSWLLGLLVYHLMFTARCFY